MNDLICIPPSKDAARAASLVPQKYVDGMFSLGTMELMTALDVGVLGAEVYQGSPAMCKWFNSEQYLHEFLEGLRERTDGTFADLSDAYKETLEKLPHTNQLPSWMRHQLSYKRQLYALATHDAIERLYTRFEALGGGHGFVDMVEHRTGLTGRDGLKYFADSRQSGIRASIRNFRAVRANGFWPKQTVKEFQAEMYGQSFRSFLGRGRFATALGDYSRNYKQNWNFVDDESLRYKAPQVLRSDQLENALARRRLELDGYDTTGQRAIGDAARTTEQRRSFTEAYGAGPSRLRRATEEATQSFENFGVQAANIRLPEGWVDESSPRHEGAPSDLPEEETNPGDESRTSLRYVSTPMGRDRQTYDQAVRRASPNVQSSSQGFWPADIGEPARMEYEVPRPVAFEMPDPTPSDLDLRARITRLATEMNVPESRIIQYNHRWTHDDPMPDNLLSDPVYDDETQSFSATRAEVRPQPNPNIQPNPNFQNVTGTTYEII